MKIGGLVEWLLHDTSTNYILGYGSLLSESSREQHSNIVCPSMFVNVLGYQRGWVTRSLEEQQTYLGARASVGSELNAQLIPVQFDASFNKREQDYEFILVDLDSIFAPNALDTTRIREILACKKVWICNTLAVTTATQDYPVTASYVATCIMGCLAADTYTIKNTVKNNTINLEQATHFIQHTKHWPKRLYNDLNKPLYPRHADFSHPLFKQAKRIMLEQGMINH